MYTVEKTWLTGWVMLPCFTIKTLKDDRYEAQLTCGKVAEWIFINFFAAFWSGKVHITGSYTEG